MQKVKTHTLFIFNGFFTFNRYIHLLITKQCSNNDYNNKLYHRFFLSTVNYNCQEPISINQSLQRNQKYFSGGINL